MTLTERVPLAENEAGELYLEGSRVFLQDLLEFYREGRSPEEMAAAYPGLALADIYAVLAWALRHPQEVEVYLEQCRARSREAEAKTHTYRSPILRQRLEERGG